MTTLATLQNDDGIRYGWVLCIEGYSKLLTNLADPTDLFTSGQGWDGTDWSSALTGLTIDTDFEQELEPWSSKIRAASIGVTVRDPDDAFGEAVFRRNAGNEAEITEDLDANETGINTSSDPGWTLPGTLYIGTEAINASSYGLGAITVAANGRGYLHPFATDSGTANRFGREHHRPDADWDVHWNPVVTDSPNGWIGKWVGLWLHEVRGGRVNTRANARLVFAGTMEEPTDNADTSVSFRCVGVRQKLVDTVLMRNQFRGRLSNGIRVQSGQKALCRVAHQGSGTTATSSEFEVVASGASGATEIDEGYYTANELMSKLNEFFNGEASTIGPWELLLVNADDPNAPQHCAVKFDLAGIAGAASMTNWCQLLIPKSWANAFGFIDYPTNDYSGQNLAHLYSYVAGQQDETLTAQKPFGQFVLALGGGTNQRIILESKQGNWINQNDWLPEPWDGYANSGQAWGFMRIASDVFVLANQDPEQSDDDLGRRTFEIRGDPVIGNVFGRSTSISNDGESVLLESNQDGFVDCRQIVAVQGGLKDILARLFYSTGASGYNHTTYDDWDYQLGAGIPGSLLGTAFERSLDDMDADNLQDSMVIILDKPTKLEEVLGPELALRNSFLVWKDEGLRFVSPQALSSSLSAHTLTEANKASAQPKDPQLAPTRISRKHMRNILKVQMSRDLVTGQYLDNVEVRFQKSITDHGSAKPITLKARNSFARWTATGDAVEQAIIDLVSRVLPAWGRPLRIMQRTIDSSLFESVAPGDIVTVTDKFARNPETGKRGVTGKVGMVLKHVWSIGGDGRDPHGSMDVIFADFDNDAIWSPTAQVASYDHGTKTLTCETHEHSDATEAADATHFVTSDKIMLVEISPAVAASATTYSDTVASQSGDDIVLTTGDAQIATDISGGMKFRVISQTYTNAVSTQKTDAYLADDSDLQILNSRVPYVWTAGEASDLDLSQAAATELCERHSDEMHADGSPLSTGHGRALARNNNNLISYGTAPQQSLMWSASSPIAGPASTNWKILIDGPLFVGVGLFQQGNKRQITIAPLMNRSASGATQKIRVTINRAGPAGNSLSSASFPEPKQQVTWTTTTTSPSFEKGTETAFDVPYSSTGWVWITVEAAQAATHGSSVAGFYGLMVNEMGPLA